ncbi:MAG: serine/threonine-protein kinase [Cyanobacteriota bacterium]|nr:serine/threonine-protein kinase [Cyanobacteriota bacterium]
MTFCLNPQCPKPQNPDSGKFCIHCGWRLRLGDRYRAIQLLSASRVNPTFLALDEERATRCIIKQFRSQSTPQESIAAFRAEVAQLERLGKHPQLPELLAYFEGDRDRYLIQAFVSGENLADRLRRSGPFAEIQVRQVLWHLLPVLQTLHRVRLVHRNIKPENIIARSSEVENGSSLVLVGFGAAKAVSGTAKVKTGTVVGSAEYTAPEQLLGKATGQSDIYSLGVTCIHLLTQVSPFDLFDNFFGRWMWRDYLPHPIGDRLGRILDRCIAMGLGDRYSSAEAAMQDLDPKFFSQVREKAPIPAKRPPKPFKKWRCDRTFKTSATEEIAAVALNADGTMAAIGNWQGRIQIWDIETGDLCQTLSAGETGVLSIAFDPHHRTLFASSADGSIRVWQPIAPTEFAATPTRTWRGHQNVVTALLPFPDGSTLATGSRDRTVKLWNWRTGAEIRTFAGHSQPITAIAIDPRSDRLVSASLDGTLKVWHRRTGELLRTPIDSGGAVYAMAIVPEREAIVGGSWDGTVKWWHLPTGSLQGTLGSRTLAISAIAVDPERQIIAAGSHDATVKLWHWPGGENPARDLPEQTLIGHARGVRAVVFDRQSRRLIGASQDGTIKLWQCE